MTEQTPEQLEPVDVTADAAELADHPDEVTDEQATEGLAVYRAVDDLDDESNGLDQ